MLKELIPGIDYFESYQGAVNHCEKHPELPQQFIIESDTKIKRFFVELTKPTIHKHEKLRATFINGEKYTKKEKNKNQVKLEL